MYRKHVILLIFLFVTGLIGRASADTITLQAQFVSARTVVLSWSAMPGTVTTVMRQYPGETAYMEIGSTSEESYTDRHGRAVCGDTVRYSIIQTLPGGENRGFAAVFVDDAEPTAMAEWGVVTVDADMQSLVLHWEASQDSDIMGYLVCEGSPSMAIDTVFGRENTEYNPVQYNVDQVYEFRICAFDSCRQASPLTDAACNMVLTLSVEPCSRQVAARWNLYRNMPGGVGRYELYERENGGAFRSVTVGSDGEATFNVSDTAVTVEAYVRVVSADGSLEALSNRTALTFSSTERPAYMYLRKVSVSDDGKTVIVIGQTDPAFTGDYRLYRSTEGGGSSVVAHIDQTADGTLEWIDRCVSPQEQVYSYWFGVYDGCGTSEIMTQKGSTILPEVQEYEGTVKLSWNAYLGWTGTTSYEVWQRNVGEEIWQSAGGGTGTNLSLPAARGTVSYKVLAYEGADSRYGRNDSLASAEVVYCPHTDIWVPNAFTPLESSNNLFCPKTLYAEEYSLTVYNRSGLMVFCSDDPSEGWDGTWQGRLQPAGAYAYILTYRQNNGTKQFIRGTVLLIW